MMKKTALAALNERFHAILRAFDELETDETLEELNAQFEDILFLMESIDEDDEDAQEEMLGVIEELQDVGCEYRELAQKRAELEQTVIELEMAVALAARNLNAE